MSRTIEISEEDCLSVEGWNYPEDCASSRIKADVIAARPAPRKSRVVTIEGDTYISGPRADYWTDSDNSLLTYAHDSALERVWQLEHQKKTSSLSMPWGLLTPIFVGTFLIAMSALSMGVSQTIVISVAYVAIATYWVAEGVAMARQE